MDRANAPAGRAEDFIGGLPPKADLHASISHQVCHFPAATFPLAGIYGNPPRFRESYASAGSGSCGAGGKDASLAPASFYEHPVVAAADPTMLHPAAASMRGNFPASRYPNVGVAIPPVITLDPNEMRTGPGWRSLHNRGGGRNPDDDFGAKRTCAQKQSKSRTDH